MRASPVGAVACILAVALMLGTAAFVAPSPASTHGSSLAGRVSTPLLEPSSSSSTHWSVAGLRTGSFVSASDPEPGLVVPGATLFGPASFVSPADPAGTTPILLTLNFSNTTQLNQLLSQLSNPSSPQFHRYLTHAEFDQQFGGAPAAYSALTGYFESFGVLGLVTHPDRLTITFQATPTQIDAIFHTQLESYRSLQGLSYFAPASSPQIPAALAPYVREVVGFSNYSESLVHVDSHMVRAPAGGGLNPLATAASSSTLAASSCGAACSPGGAANPFRATTVGGLTYDAPVYADRGNASGCSTVICGDFVQAPDLQVTYNESALFQQYGYPENATVAAMLWTDPICTSNTGQCRLSGLFNSYCHGLTKGSYAWDFFRPDVTSFWNYSIPAGEPMPNAFGLPITGSSSYAYPVGSQGLTASCDNGGAEGENTLDVAMLGAMAPGANVIDVFGQGSSGTTLLTEFADIVSPSLSEFSNAGGTDTAANIANLANVSVISNSWTSSGSLGSSWNADLEEAQALGITVLASSGDSGNNAVAPPAATAFNTYGDVAVGGTTVVVNNSLQRTREHLASLDSPYLGVGGGEVVWYEPAGSTYGFSSTLGSVGGVTTASSNYAPVWQNSSADAHSVIVGIAGSNPGRGVPDIAAIANDTLIDVEIGPYSFNFTCIVDSACASVSSINTGATTVAWTYFVGTSIASPVMAGVIATMDYALEKAGAGRVGFLDPAAYSYGQLEYGGNLVAPPFYDVVLYHNSEPSSTYGAFPGWDAVTGWGPIDAGNYVRTVLAPPSPSSFPTPIRHVVVVMDENRNYSDVMQNASFEAYLAHTYATSTNSFALQHGSVPSYQAATSAVDYRNWTIGVPNLGDLAQQGDLSWAAFQESMPLPCGLETNWSVGYYRAHNPFTMYSNIAHNPTRCEAHDLTWSSWLNDVNTSTLPNYAFLTPNTTNDAHNGTLLQADQWLHDLLTPLVNDSAVFADTAFIITYDEANANYAPLVNGTTGGPIYTVVVSPYSRGLSSNHFYTSFSLLTTTEWLLGLPGGTLGTNDSWAVSPPMTDLFSFPPASLHTVTFTESGLAAGTNWSVTLAGATESSTGSTISFSMPNATYPYTIGGVGGHLAVPGSGSTTVNGAPVSVPVPFLLENSALQTLLDLYNARLDLRTAFPNALNSTTSVSELVNWAGGVVEGQWSDSNYSTLEPFGYWYLLMKTYDGRSDLQAAFPDAYATLSSYEGLVAWAGNAVSGVFEDGSAPTLQPYGYYYVLMGTYSSRSDLQAAFPDAFSNSTNYTNLVTWAYNVVTGVFSDGSAAYLQSFGYYYTLFIVYHSRSDLQAVYPNAFSDLSSYEGLVNWAGGAVSGAFSDGDATLLQPYGYYYVLLGTYGSRSDLQAAFPDAYSNLTRYTELETWAYDVTVGVLSDGSATALQPYGYYYDLQLVYNSRSDLQAAYPHAYTNYGVYQSLLVWAKDVVDQVFPDAAYTTLLPFASYYDSYG